MNHRDPWNIDSVISPEGGNKTAKRRSNKSKGKGKPIVPGSTFQATISQHNADAALSLRSPASTSKRKPTAPSRKQSIPKLQVHHKQKLPGRQRNSGDFLDMADQKQSQSSYSRVASTKSSRRKQRTDPVTRDSLHSLAPPSQDNRRMRNFGTPSGSPPSNVCDLDEFMDGPQSQDELRQFSHVRPEKKEEVVDVDDEEEVEEVNANDSSGKFAQDIIGNLDLNRTTRKPSKHKRSNNASPTSPNNTLSFRKVNININNKRKPTQHINSEIYDDEIEESPSSSRCSQSFQSEMAGRRNKRNQMSKRKHFRMDDDDSDYENSNILKRTKKMVNNGFDKIFNRFSPPLRRKSKRIKKKSASNDVIELSSDEESVEPSEELIDDSSIQEAYTNVCEDVDSISGGDNGLILPTSSAIRRSPRVRGLGSRLVCPATRIAIGKQIFKGSCIISYQPGSSEPYLRIAYTKDSATLETYHDTLIKDEEIVELHYYIPDDEDSSPCSENDENPVAANDINNASNSVLTNAFQKENEAGSFGMDTAERKVGMCSDEDVTNKDDDTDKEGDETITNRKSGDEYYKQSTPSDMDTTENRVGQSSDVDVSNKDDSPDEEVDEAINGKKSDIKYHEESTSSDMDNVENRVGKSFDKDMTIKHYDIDKEINDNVTKNDKIADDELQGEDTSIGFGEVGKSSDEILNSTHPHHIIRSGLKADNVVIDSAIPKTQCSYLILRIKPTDKNGLSTFKNSYLSNERYEVASTKADKKKRFIIVETTDKSSFQAIIDIMRETDELTPFLHSKLKEDKKDSLITAFQASAKTRKKSMVPAKYKEHETVLVFPFQAHDAELNSAANVLTEASGKLPVANSATMFASLESTCESGPAENLKAKVHTITIHGEDYGRLDPCEFLNDTLIDFWISWLTRRMGAAANNVHVFTTQFYSKLEDEGAEAVASWTAKKGVDIFEKKFIFIPVNKNIHWSLFVIVNPGMVENAADDLLVDDDEVLEHPFLLFMDSLKAHKMSRMRKHIQGWMNFEAKRLGKFKNLHKKDPFDSLTLPVISPKVPYQNNSWDCGVFVCRYAFNMLRLLNVPFAHKHSEWMIPAKRREQFRKWITESPEFDFDMRDIARLRVEIASLIDSLSALYTNKLELRNKQKKLLAEKKKKDPEKKFQCHGSIVV